jgi:hypothetical protein
MKYPQSIKAPSEGLRKKYGKLKILSSVIIVLWKVPNSSCNPTNSVM